MRRRRRIGAYGLCWDEDRVLLVRSSAAAGIPGVWQLPGGGLAHAEDPRTTVVREFGEETGLRIEITAPLRVISDVLRFPAATVHTDRIVFQVRSTERTLRAESGGTTDAARWFSPAELVDLPLMPYTAELLDQPVRALPAPVRDVPGEPLRTDRGQRFAAYGLTTDPADRLLLTRIAAGYPGAGCWHLPGGGTDHGEQPVTGLLREIVEETGQSGQVTELLDISHSHDPAAIGPEGYPVDWHAVHAVYRVLVGAPSDPSVNEAIGGSTEQARWFTRQELRRVPLTAVAERAIAILSWENSA
jgi:8-oxo-dGTP diphosphatase